jgi:hypothetical protein
MRKLILMLLLSFAFTFTLFAEEAPVVKAAPVDGVAVTDAGQLVLKAPGRYGIQRWTITPDAAPEQKLYKLQVTSRPNITVTRTRATIDSDGVVQGSTEQRVRRGFFPLFRRARFVPVE